jgi:hypothetical protein
MKTKMNRLNRQIWNLKMPEFYFPYKNLDLLPALLSGFISANDFPF